MYVNWMNDEQIEMKLFSFITPLPEDPSNCWLFYIAALP